MRILHISTRLILGGSQENTILSCEGQTRLGHDVHLAYGPIYGPEGSMLERVQGFRTADSRAITRHEIPTLVRELSPLTDWRCYHELRTLIQRIAPDVVHTHSSKAGILGRAAAWAEGGRAGRRAVVHTIHGPPFHRFEKRWRNAIYVLSERFAAKRCHAIVSVADAMTRQFLARGIGRAEQYSTIHSGMEVEPYLAHPAPAAADSRQSVRRELRLADEHIVIGTVARLAELKGHDDLIDALSEDLRAHPEWRLLWVGDGWWRERLTRRLDEAGLRDRVILTGLVPPERIPALMRAMDVLVHPSYREGLPRTVPQALLAGVPVVAYNTDGAGEACIDMRTGRLVPTGDIPALRAAIRWTIDHPAESRALAQAGRELCRTRFSAQTMVTALDQLYTRLTTKSLHTR
jgi:glycosyltransferase involved in cell wall biosynthesis